MALDAESPLVNKEPDPIDLAFPLWDSNEVTIAIVVALGVLTGTGLIAWPVFDALTSRQLDNEGRVLLVGESRRAAGCQRSYDVPLVADCGV